MRAKIWVKNLLGKENSKCKASEMGKSLAVRGITIRQVLWQLKEQGRKNSSK